MSTQRIYQAQGPVAHAHEDDWAKDRLQYSPSSSTFVDTCGAIATFDSWGTHLLYQNTILTKFDPIDNVGEGNCGPYAAAMMLIEEGAMPPRPRRVTGPERLRNCEARSTRLTQSV